MTSALPGLTRISLPDLQQLLRLLETSRLAAPLDPTALQAAGLGNLWPTLEGYSDLEARPLTLLLQVAAAERTQRPVPRLELVWTGPEPAASRARDTGVVVRELFRGAKRSVLVGGYSFDHSEEILKELHLSMADRGVEATFFVNLEKDAKLNPGLGPEEVADAFLKRNWPFGRPGPTVYYDPATANVRTRTSLHAKCVVVDEEIAFVTSANFTNRGQTRNVELGVKIEDPAFARLVIEQWRSLIGADGFQRLSGS